MCRKGRLPNRQRAGAARIYAIAACIGGGEDRRTGVPVRQVTARHRPADQLAGRSARGRRPGTGGLVERRTRSRQHILPCGPCPAPPAAPVCRVGPVVAARLAFAKRPAPPRQRRGPGGPIGDAAPRVRPDARARSLGHSLRSDCCGCPLSVGGATCRPLADGRTRAPGSVRMGSVTLTAHRAVVGGDRTPALGPRRPWGVRSGDPPSACRLSVR